MQHKALEVTAAKECDKHLCCWCYLVLRGKGEVVSCGKRTRETGQLPMSAESPCATIVVLSTHLRLSGLVLCHRWGCCFSFVVGTFGGAGVFRLFSGLCHLWKCVSGLVVLFGKFIAGLLLCFYVLLLGKIIA